MEDRPGNLGLGSAQLCQNTLERDDRVLARVNGNRGYPLTAGRIETT